MTDLTQKTNPTTLQRLAKLAYFFAAVFGAVFVGGLFITKAYPASTLQYILFGGIGFASLLTFLFIHNLNSTKWTDKLFALCTAALCIYLGLKGLALRHAIETSALTTSTWLHIIEVTYYGLIVSLLMCAKFLQFRSDIALDKTTIPRAVDLSGLMMLFIGLTLSTRYLILYYLDIPMYSHLHFMVGFTLITICFIGMTYFGKYGALYRTRQGRKGFTTFSLYLLVFSLMHVFFSLPQALVNLYHFTPEQLAITNTANHVGGAIEIVACVIILIAMQTRQAKQYYLQFDQELPARRI